MGLFFGKKDKGFEDFQRQLKELKDTLDRMPPMQSLEQRFGLTPEETKAFMFTGALMKMYSTLDEEFGAMILTEQYGIPENRAREIFRFATKV